MELAGRILKCTQGPNGGSLHFSTRAAAAAAEPQSHVVIVSLHCLPLSLSLSLTECMSIYLSPEMFFATIILIARNLAHI